MGCTPLHMAVIKGSAEAIAVLVRACNYMRCTCCRLLLPPRPSVADALCMRYHHTSFSTPCPRARTRRCTSPLLGLRASFNSRIRRNPLHPHPHPSPSTHPLLPFPRPHCICQMRAGADPNTPDGDGYTPAGEAQDMGDPAIIAALQHTAGADAAQP